MAAQWAATWRCCSGRGPIVVTRCSGNPACILFFYVCLWYLPALWLFGFDESTDRSDHHTPELALSLIITTPNLA
jgi:hypothetical protein